LDVEYKEKVRENEDKADEINILKIELQKYITEVGKINYLDKFLTEKH